VYWGGDHPALHNHHHHDDHHNNHDHDDAGTRLRHLLMDLERVGLVS